MTKEIIIINDYATINEKLKSFLISNGLKLDTWESIYDDTQIEEDDYYDFYNFLHCTDTRFATIDPLALRKECNEYWDTLKETGNPNEIKIFRLDRYSIDELLETLEWWYTR